MHELMLYCIEHQNKIFVRAQVAGKWQSVPLSELPFSVAIKHILRWNEEGTLPVRML